MDKKYYALRLLPPRPTFSQDMTPDERAVMMQHLTYWRALMDKDKVIVFGPVLDPKGAYGLGIIAVENEAEVKTFIADDPAVKINLVYEYDQMLAVVKT
jgi:uncharacterized protein YciI